MNKVLYFPMEVAGLVLLGFFAFSDMVFFEKLIGLVLGVFLFVYPILMNEKEIQSNDFERLNPGVYAFLTTPVQATSCSTCGNCVKYFVHLEQNGKVIPVEIGIVSKIRIHKAMGPIDEIKRGKKFKINNDSNITNIEI